MRYTIDTEFDGHGGPLISLALVPEVGGVFYWITDHEPEDPWVVENVMPFLDIADLRVFESYWFGGGEEHIGQHLRDYLRDDPHPVIMADSAIDIGRFAHYIHTQDGQYISSDNERITFEIYNVDCWPNSLKAPAVQHNAYWDAVALWEKLDEIIPNQPE